MYKAFKFIMSASAFMIVQPVCAASYSVSGAHIVSVEGTYSPSDVRFVVDSPAGACASGSILIFHPQGQNDAQRVASASAVMATILTAKATNSTLVFGGDDNGCSVSYVIGTK